MKLVTRTFLQLVMQVENISLDTVSRIQKYLEPGEVISLIFLLDEYSERALAKVIEYQRVSEIGGKPANILLDWAKDAVCKRGFWKWELVDALFTCQLFSIVKEIGGVDMPIFEQHFTMSQIQYVHPIKKQIYKVCENMNSICYAKLIKKLSEDYGVVIPDYENCEILFLQLMCKGFFSIPSSSNLNKVNVDLLVNVLEEIHELRELCTEIKNLIAINNYNCNKGTLNDTSFCNARETFCKDMELQKEKHEDLILHVNDFDESFLLLNQLTLEDAFSNLKADNEMK